MDLSNCVCRIPAKKSPDHFSVRSLGHRNYSVVSYHRNNCNLAGKEMNQSLRLLRFTDFRPGACGFPLRGEAFSASFTNSSNRAFGTFSTPRMTSLKCWNSGVESKAGSFINLPSSLSFTASLAGLSGSWVPSAGIGLTELTSEFFVSHAASDNLFHDDGKPLRIGHLARVEPEGLLIDVTEQVERLHADVGTAQSALQQAPE